MTRKHADPNIRSKGALYLTESSSVALTIFQRVSSDAQRVEMLLHVKYLQILKCLLVKVKRI